MLVELAVRHFPGGTDDGIAEPFRHRAEGHVAARGGHLDDTERMHGRERHALSTDVEIFQ